MKPNKHFWQFVNAADSNSPPELTLYGDISDKTWYGDTVTPNQFAKELAALGKVSEIVVRIDSSGGDVFAANAIYTRLKDHPAKITVKIDGWAASAATIIAMAGDTIAIPANGVFMIHDPLVGVFGYFNEADLTKLTGELQVIKQAILHTYAAKTGKSTDDIAALMTAETWYDGKQAVEAGFCDTLLFEEAKRTEEVEKTEITDHIPLISAKGNGFSVAAHFASALQTKNQKEVSNMPEIKTVEELQATYPTLVNQIMDKAVQEERKRLQDIEAIAIDGFESVIQQAKYEKPLSAGEVAQAILVEQKKQGAQYLNSREQDVQASNVNSVPSDPAPQAQINEVEAAIDRVFPKVK